MKKLLGLVSLAALMTGLSFNSAQAQTWYVEGQVGVTNIEELDWQGGAFDMDDGENYGVAFGRSMWGAWDAELEWSYDRMDYACCSPNNTHEYRLMANLTRNFALGPVTPYLGGGLGAAWVTYEPSDVQDTVLAYQLIGGVRLPLGDRFAIFGEYRYHDLFEEADDGGITWDHAGHDFTFGVRLNLN